jgi:hypothetical protein
MDIAEFYDGDPRRRESSEVQFGDGWSTEQDQHSTYRVEWLNETGELYVVREPHPGGLFARYLDQLDVDQADVQQITVEILARYADEAEVQRALAGWQTEMTHPDSLSWLRKRTQPAEPA